MSNGPMRRFWRACMAAALLAPAIGAIGAHAEDPNPATLNIRGGAWPLYRQWTPAETRHFAAWVEHLYDKKWRGTRPQRLAKIEAVLTDPDMNLLLDPAFAGDPCNPQLSRKTMRAIHSVLDCGKLTIALGSYYACRRGLPWMGTRIRSGDGSDIRRSPHNVPVGAYTCRQYGSAHALITDAVWSFCTGNYRIEPTHERAILSDTVPVAIRRDTLLPGALFYMDGHVLMLAKAGPYGGLRFLDATTSPTRDIYTHNALNAVTGITPSNGGDQPYKGCFQGFRIFRYPIAEVDENGRLIRVRRRTDAEMAEFGYSLEQYDRLRELAETGFIRVDGLKLDSLHDFVRYRMRRAQRIAPAEVLEAFAKKMHALLLKREARVQEGWREVRENGPIVFPEGDRDRTIFNDQGRWGRFSTVHLDTELREDYYAVAELIRSAIHWYRLDPEYVVLPEPLVDGDWEEAGLGVALNGVKNQCFAQRGFSYTNSREEPVELSLLDVEERLFNLSFDPNHPPELRWGAPWGSREMPGAEAVPTPLPGGEQMPLREAYEREARYRVMTYRDIEASTLRVEQEYRQPSRFGTFLVERAASGRVPPLVPHAWQVNRGW